MHMPQSNVRLFCKMNAASRKTLSALPRKTALHLAANSPGRASTILDFFLGDRIKRKKQDVNLPGSSECLKQHSSGKDASSSEAFLDSKKLCGPSVSPAHANRPRKTAFGFKEATNEVQIEPVRF